MEHPGTQILSVEFQENVAAETAIQNLQIPQYLTVHKENSKLCGKVA